VAMAAVSLWTGGACRTGRCKGGKPWPQAPGSQPSAKSKSAPQLIAKAYERRNDLAADHLERNEPVLTPGSLMTRFKEWVPCALWPILENDYDVRPQWCTDSRLSQSLKPEHCQKKASQIAKHTKQEEEKGSF